MAVKWTGANWKKGDVWAHISEEEMNRFRSAINDMVEKTGQTFQKVVRNMARDVARAAMAKTSIAPKSRLLSISGDQEKYWVHLKNKWTGENVTFAASMEDCLKYNYPLVEQVKNRGFMKSGWASILYKLGVNGGKESSLIKNPKWGNVSSSGSLSNSKITIFQDVPFMTEWDAERNRWKTPQHIVERSIVEVSNYWTDVLRYFANSSSLGPDAFRAYYNHLAQLAKKANQKYEVIYEYKGE